MRALTEAGTLYEPPFREYQPPPARPPHRQGDSAPVASHDPLATPGREEGTIMARTTKPAGAAAAKQQHHHLHQPSPGSKAGQILTALRKRAGNMTSEQISQATGLSRDRVSVELAGLRKRGLVRRWEGATAGGAVQYYAVQFGPAGPQAPVSAETAPAPLADAALTLALARVGERLQTTQQKPAIAHRERRIAVLRELARLLDDSLAAELTAVADYLQEAP